MRRSIHPLALCGAFAALALVVAPGARASTPTLYHGGATPPYSDPGVSSFPPANRTLNLVLFPGGVDHTTGVPCETSNGDNPCGVYAEIEVDGDLTIAGPSSFTFAASGQQSKNVVNSKKLRIALVNTTGSLSSAAFLLGTLTVTSGPNGGAVKLSKLQTVDGSVDLRTGDPRTIAVLPEPGWRLQVAAGIGALALLGRRRALRGEVR